MLIYTGTCNLDIRCGHKPMLFLYCRLHIGVLRVQVVTSCDAVKMLPVSG